MTNTVAKNTSWFTGALVIQKLITFVYFAYLANVLGAELLGRYVFVLSFITLFSLLVDVGTNHYLTREVARNTTLAQKLFSNVLGFKLISSVVAIVIAYITATILNYNSDIMQLLYIAFAIMIVESFVLSTYAIIRGFQNLKFEAVTTVIVHIIIFISGFLVLQNTQNVGFLLLVLLLAHSANILFGVYILRTKFFVLFKLGFDIQLWKKVFRIVLPFALAAGFAKVYGAFDQVMLSKLASEVELGFYAVAYKLTFALQFIPMALIAPLYPAFSKINKNNNKLNNLFNKSFIYLLTISLPIVMLVVFFARDIILLIYSEVFIASVMPLTLLMISIPFLFLNFPIGSLLNATDYQKVQTRNVGIALLLNIILNAILIPKYQASGAAFASSLSTFLLFAIGIYSVIKYTGIDVKDILGLILKLITSTIIMSIVMWLLLMYVAVYWMVVALIGILVYVLILFVARIITVQDVRNLFKS